MNLTCRYLQDDWELYALGGLEREAQESMFAHLESGCNECRQRYFAAQAALTAMSTLAPNRRPSPNVERKLMRAIQSDRTPATYGWSLWRPFPWVGAVACLLLVLWFARDHNRLQLELAESRENVMLAQQHAKALQEQLVANLNAPQDSGKPPAANTVAVPPVIAPSSTADAARLKAELAQTREQAQAAEAAAAALQRQVAQLQADLASAANRTATLEKELQSAENQVAHADSEKSRALAAALAKSQSDVQRLSAAANDTAKLQQLLQSASLEQISLRSVNSQGGHATARALYSPQGGLLLLADSLPKLPDQKCYQLWLIRKASPAILSAGLINLQDDGKGMLYAPPSADLEEVTALAITDEPAGGSVSARGQKLLFGARSRLAR